MEPIKSPHEEEDPALKRLRQAVRGIPVDPRLRAKVRRLLDSRGFQFGRWEKLALGLLAALVLGVVVPRWLDPAPFFPRAYDVEARLEEIQAPFRPGMGDHLACALQLGKSPILAADQMPVRAEFSEFRQLALTTLPVGYAPSSFHECRFAGRTLTHLIVRRGDDVMSLIVTARPAGGGTGAVPAGHDSGQATLPPYSITAVESGQLQLFVVSSHGSERDAEFLNGAGRPLRDFLERLQSKGTIVAARVAPAMP